LRLGQLRNREQAVQAHAFGELAEVVREFPLLLGGGLGVIGEGGSQQGRGMAALLKGGRRDRQAMDGFVVEGEPGGQVVRAVAQPEQRIEQWGAVGRGDDGMGGMGELFAGGEEFMFGLGELLDADRHSGSVIDYGGGADIGGDQQAQETGQAVEADRHRVARVELAIEDAAGELAGSGGMGMDAHSVNAVIHQQELIAVHRQGFPKTIQRRQQNVLPVEGREEQVADGAGKDELRANTEQAVQVGNPAGPEGRSG